MQEDDACLSLEQGCPDVEDGSLGISQARMTMPGDNMSPGSLEPHDLFCMSQLDSSSKHEDAALAPAASCPDLTAHFQHSGTVEGNSHFNPDTLIPLDEEMEPSSTDTFLGSFWEPCNMLKICQDVMMGPFIRSD